MNPKGKLKKKTIFKEKNARNKNISKERKEKEMNFFEFSYYFLFL